MKAKKWVLYSLSTLAIALGLRIAHVEYKKIVFKEMITRMTFENNNSEMEYYLIGSTIFLGGWADGVDQTIRAEQIAQAVIEMDRPFYFGASPKIINRIEIKDQYPLALRK